MVCRERLRPKVLGLLDWLAGWEFKDGSLEEGGWPSGSAYGAGIPGIAEEVRELRRSGNGETGRKQEFSSTGRGGEHYDPETSVEKKGPFGESWMGFPRAIRLAVCGRSWSENQESTQRNMR